MGERYTIFVNDNLACQSSKLTYIGFQDESLKIPQIIHIPLVPPPLSPVHSFCPILDPSTGLLQSWPLAHAGMVLLRWIYTQRVVVGHLFMQEVQGFSRN